MWWWIKLQFAGLSHLLWHWGIGVGVIILILAVEFFTAQIVATIPILDRPLNAIRKDLLWVAVAIALVLAGEFVGAKDMAGRCEAKSDVVRQQVKDAVTRANKSPGLDQWDTNK